MSSADRQDETSEPGNSPSASVKDFARLVFCIQGGKVVSKDILRDTTLIGSSHGCNIQLVAPGISEAHCVITLESRALTLRDLRSRSGTRLNNSPINVGRLNNEDIVAVGPFEFRVETNLCGELSGDDEPNDRSQRPTLTYDNAAASVLPTANDEFLQKKEEFERQCQQLQEEQNELQAARGRLEVEREQLRLQQQQYAEYWTSLGAARQHLAQQQEQVAKTTAELDHRRREIEQIRQQMLLEKAELDAQRNELSADLSGFRQEQQRFRENITSAETDAGAPKQPSRQPIKFVSDLDVAKTLVINGLISSFQADWLVEGRFQEFVIGKYRVIELLDAGGMGWLYLAEEIETRKKVALKVLSKSNGDDAGMRARFELEARAGARLDHPNIVQTFNFGETDDHLYYLAMEFVEGVNLMELIGLHGPIAWKQACDFMRQTALGLSHAHEMGLVHRDIKPANLLTDAEGKLKILDFGLALLDENEDEFSLAMIFGHDCLGTADYIAPEQSLDSFTVDARADVYGLGCTFYFILTGVLPFPMKQISDKLAAHRTRMAEPLAKLAPDIPKVLVEIVEKMMAKKPQQRFQSAAEVALALEPMAENQPASFDFSAVLSARAAVARQRLRLAAKISRKERSSMAMSDSKRSGSLGGQSSTLRR